jgi:hypothetical protein
VSAPFPFGTAKTGLVPTITVSPGASVSPAPDAAWDFTNPVTYTVTAEDGTAAQWTVTAVEAFTSVSAVTSWLSSASGGTAANDPVSTPVPLGINLTDSDGNGWTDLLQAIGAKYVNLDLSHCTMSGTEFDPDYTISTGKNRIVSLILPDAATSIKAGDYPSNSTFEYFTVLKNVTGKAITSVGEDAFYNCDTLKTVSLPVATSIDDGAFSYCDVLETVNLPAATTIGQSTFRDCISLTMVNTPAVISINFGGFAGCTALTMIDLPAVTSINDGFVGCTSLTTANIPLFTFMGGNPFAGCTNLTTITVATDNPNCKVEDGKLLTKDGKFLIGWPTATGSVDLPGITTIGSSAFKGCTTLTTVNLPDATTIDPNAFGSCTGLTTVNLPAATHFIWNAFSYTGTGPLVITLGDTPPELRQTIFSGVTGGPKPVTVKVPNNAAWSGIIGGSFTDAENTTGGPHWGEGFRGKGWTSGGAYVEGGTVNENISLTIEALP